MTTTTLKAEVLSLVTGKETRDGGLNHFYNPVLEIAAWSGASALRARVEVEIRRPGDAEVQTPQWEKQQSDGSWSDAHMSCKDVAWYGTGKQFKREVGSFALSFYMAQRERGPLGVLWAICELARRRQEEARQVYRAAVIRFDGEDGEDMDPDFYPFDRIYERRCAQHARARDIFKHVGMLMLDDKLYRAVEYGRSRGEDAPAVDPFGTLAW